MIHRLGGSFRIVDVNAGHAQTWAELAAIDDRGASRRHGFDEARCLFGQPVTEKNKTIGLPALEHLRVTLLAFHVMLRVAHQYGISLAERGVLDALNDQRK